ncbi:MAG TPA: type I secretion system permease/ATPase, partial [Xanthomonadaceae bacterium]|nr:type I secretion system permease/ATPase [Xanthomonadaceae bacterium]
QRIAIARALITDPRILILDEATSALDYESEHAVMANMHAICKGRTVLIIAHRLSTVRRANRIVVVEKGQIVETGTHAELVDRPDGHYARLHRLQAGVP